MGKLQTAIRQNPHPNPLPEYREREKSRRRAFSLVELLVVIGIVSLLIAMLMPVLSAARQASQSTQCLSNLRQMAIAAHQYAIENSGRFPIAYYSGSNPPLAYGYNWDFTLVL